ncbi:DUF2560 family protein [Providencia stuartii]|uniref:DUF2560 family protein n=1 Tax=Providencia TaxID=586 RepID=UPI00090A024B|nr:MULTISPECIES: DUF2560 family protein [Providencia]APG52660.1 hypothetical protein BGK56_17630 [Providencia stuartii]AVL39419.1 DUF2560 domain-containing protein [Providencia stuartii]MCL8323709.1 DUF2560 family protein [Providencia thailandensis]QET99031.1 DUF2560 family protein [Providencia stuartii]SUC43375.1 Protein of uncharacterised function (DUF2560) [Providencia stuartii]
MTTELTAKEKIRLGLLRLTGNNTAATAKAIKLINDDQLEYELFVQLWNSNNGNFDNGSVDTLTKVDSVYQRVQETKKTLFNDEVAE